MGRRNQTSEEKSPHSARILGNTGGYFLETKIEKLVASRRGKEHQIIPQHGNSKSPKFEYLQIKED